MAIKEKKRSIFAKIRNYFIAGVVVLIPIGITVYLTLFIVNVSSKTMMILSRPNKLHKFTNLQLRLSLREHRNKKCVLIKNQHYQK